MKISNHIFFEQKGWKPALPNQDEKAQLILCFGDEDSLFKGNQAHNIHCAYPNAQFTGCTTAGEIHGNAVYDNSITLTAIEFEKTDISIVTENIYKGIDCFELGKNLATQLLQKENLAHVLIFTEGLMVRGSALAKGFNHVLPKGITVTGGMAGEGREFENSRVWHQDSGPIHQIVAIGFYGKHLDIGYASLGGFDSFGPKRKITRSDDNILYELDGQSALELYKKYLGESAKSLPSSGLNFPLMLYKPNSNKGIVRTVQGINETNQSMEFADELPEGQYVQLMRANFDRLINAAYQAANQAKKHEDTELALLISCVGRRVALQNRADEEVEDVREALGEQCIFTGFYSYGELCPLGENQSCLLHNQTMTITTFKEI